MVQEQKSTAPCKNDSKAVGEQEKGEEKDGRMNGELYQ